MEKSTIRHHHLRRTINEIMSLKREDLTEEIFDRLSREFKYSNLISAGDIEADMFNLCTAKSELGEFGLLFTDMDEFRKKFPSHEVGSHPHLFSAYKDMLNRSTLQGFIINFESELFILIRDFADMIDDVPKSLFRTGNSYTPEELKSLNDSIDNSPLESFIENLDNRYDYEGLFDLISDSALFTLLASEENLETGDGIIRMDDDMFVSVRLYIDQVGGNFATAYTSQKKMENVQTLPYKYSQIVNFAYLMSFAITDDLDGIVINPNSDSIILTRDVLLEFSDVINEKCNNEKLNSGVNFAFPVEDEVCI